MVAHQASRSPGRQLLVVCTLIVLVTFSSVSSAAKCWPKAKPTPDFGYPDNDTPTVTESPNQPMPDITNQQTSEIDTPAVTESPNEQMPEILNETPTDTPENPPTQPSSDGSSGDIPTQASSEGSIANTSSTPSTSTGEHAPFGKITSASGKCVVGNPDAYISTKDVDWVWEQRLSTEIPKFKNFIFDQLVTNKGSLKYCVRWDSTNKLSKTDASKFEAMLNRQFKAWNAWLIGYSCWPFEKIDVEIVGWATRDASLFDWTDDSLGTIYTTEKDEGGVPQCPEDCYKHKGFEANADTSACKGKPFDMSLWPTLGQGGGAGGDWGQRVDADNMMTTLDSEELIIVSHEIGHGFGLPDFYKPSDQPGEDFPACIMRAGSSPTVTPGDGWMLRRILENIKSRYDF